jgi:hypothetical protein
MAKSKDVYVVVTEATYGLWKKLKLIDAKDADALLRRKPRKNGGK